MLVNVHHDSPAEHRRLLVAGVVFIALIAGLIGLSIAVYQKTFVSTTMITIKADRAGLQLSKFGDVRINGVLVGQVREVSQDGNEAAIRVAIDPDDAKVIPDNVTVQILPTTLFGQKFIALIPPAQPSGTFLRSDEVIPADRVETNVELSQILANLFPLLRAVQPAELNATLNALATALQGRGEELGVTLDKLDSYLDVLDDDLPALRQVLVELARTADVYDAAAPDLLGVLGNLTVTSKTVLAKQKDLDVFFTDLTDLATTTTRVLSTNEQNLIRVGEVTEPVVKLLADYSPEFPCLIEGAARYSPILARAFEGNQVKQYLELGTPQYRAYNESDKPVYGEVGHGPWCLGLPDNPEVPAPPLAFDNGTNIDENPPTSQVPVLANRAAVPGAATSSGFAGTDGDKAVVNALLAGSSGHSADAYGSLGSLLYGPVVRGGKGTR